MVDDQTPEEAQEEEAVEEAPPLLAEVPDDGIRRRWYAVHALSGQESNVKKTLRVLADQSGLGDLVSNVFVPMEEVAEMKAGEKKVSKRKYFPGYVLIQLPEHPEKYPELWHLIKDAPGVTGFIGPQNLPVPLDDGEVNAIVEEIRGERERPKPKVELERGDRVKVIEGPLSRMELTGTVDEIDVERGKVRLMVEVFADRLAPLDVGLWEVEKV